MPFCKQDKTCIAKALADAEAICARNGLSLTSLRRRVLELVWQSHKPIKAYDMLALLQKEMPSAQPPTIYRALTFLLDNQLIHKIQSLNAFIGCHHAASGGKHCYFMICSLCAEALEMQHHTIGQNLTETARQQHFLVQHVTVEIEGICRNCQTST